jgi:teichuronic acid biosynthesis glycosyltransferase TuaH
MVGPHDPRWEPRRFAALAARPNVSHAGRVPPEAVPSYLAATDIGITPYTGSPFNRASFPLKTLEYLSAGLPVVSADLPGARWLLDDLTRADAAPGQILTLASTPAGVVAAVRAMAVAPRDPAQADAPAPAAAQDELRRADRCRVFAARHSWARRGDALAEALGFRPAAEDRSGSAATARGR